MAGDMAGDMAKLTPKLRELLGGNFTATGKGTKPATLRRFGETDDKTA